MLTIATTTLIAATLLWVGKRAQNFVENSNRELEKNHR